MQPGIPVLVLDRENPIVVASDRLERLGTTDGPLLRYWGGWLTKRLPPCLRIRDGLGEIPQTTAARNCHSLTAFHGGDQNDASKMRAFMHQCRRLADLGSTVLVIHHDGKEIPPRTIVEVLISRRRLTSVFTFRIPVRTAVLKRFDCGVSNPVLDSPANWCTATPTVNSPAIRALITHVLLLIN